LTVCSRISGRRRFGLSHGRFLRVLRHLPKDDAFEVTAEVPGLDEKNLEVKLADGVLTIRGEKSEEKEDKEKAYHVSERHYGSFQRSFRLPDGVEADKVSAAFAKGVLKVTLPKSLTAKQNDRKIEIKAG
jgi:HSP20 family protein